MATSPVTYRVSPEVDAELKRLAKIHGGTDKVLRVLFEWASPLANMTITPIAIEEVAQWPNNRNLKPPLLKPSEKRK